FLTLIDHYTKYLQKLNIDQKRQQYHEPLIQQMLHLDNHPHHATHHSKPEDLLARPKHKHQEDGQVVRQRHGLACAFRGARQVFGRLAGGRQVRVSFRT
ncbi:hypothetical protein, partial [Pseudomonas sp. I2]|uniref:hypothetical protein n=1 Tax=Pseudomonas sp. I2 TaxID=1338438 RepID=UPI0034D6818D